MQCGIYSRGFNRLMPVSEALAALAAVCVEIAPVETSIENAAERIAASPICAPSPSRPCRSRFVTDGRFRRKIRLARPPTRPG